MHVSVKTKVRKQDDLIKSLFGGHGGKEKDDSIEGTTIGWSVFKGKD